MLNRGANWQPTATVLNTINAPGSGRQTAETPSNPRGSLSVCPVEYNNRVCSRSAIQATASVAPSNLGYRGIGRPGQQPATSQTGPQGWPTCLRSRLTTTPVAAHRVRPNNVDQKAGVPGRY